MTIFQLFSNAFLGHDYVRLDLNGRQEVRRMKYTDKAFWSSCKEMNRDTELLPAGNVCGQDGIASWYPVTTRSWTLYES